MTEQERENEEQGQLEQFALGLLTINLYGEDSLDKRDIIGGMDRMLECLSDFGEQYPEIVELTLRLYRARVESWERKAEETARDMDWDLEQHTRKSFFGKKRLESGYVSTYMPFYLGEKQVSKAYQRACEVITKTKELKDWRKEVDEDDKQSWNQLGDDRPYDSLFSFLEEKRK